MPILKVKCRTCGKPFLYEKIGRKRFYCSVRCARVWKGEIQGAPDDLNDEPELDDDSRAAKLRKINAEFLRLLHIEMLNAVREGSAT